jgi:DMSO/TMAO reductase YedYZ molybdopterin-dependent catalytic subunit
MRRLLLDLRRAVASPARNPRKAVVIGRLLGSAFVLCFLTGLVSHYLQHPEPWMAWTPRPEWGYQLNQGVHVTTGLLCIPLLLAKLWVVYPDLFRLPLIGGLGSVLERGSIAIFVGSTLVQLAIGVLNTYQFLPLPFYFLQVHFALSFVILGSLALHIAVKLPIISRYWRRPADGDEGALEVPERVPEPAIAAPPGRGVTGRAMAFIDATPAPPAKVSRRGLLAGVGLSAAALLMLTVGQTLTPLDPLNLFAPRKKGTGPQGLLVNRTSAQAGVADAATDAAWALTVTNGERTIALTRAQLLAMPQIDAALPIACVEGWSQTATWRGVRLRELVALVDADPGAELEIRSLERKGAYKTTRMAAEYVRDDETMVALAVNGEPLHLEHGYPARILAPGRPGVLQTKWLDTIEVRA